MENLSNSVRPQYRLLTEDQLQQLHEASLQILEKIGVRVPHETALNLLVKAGCSVTENQVARIPARLVEESIKSAPKLIEIFNREGGTAMRLGGRNSYFGLGTDLIRTVDLDTGQHRASLLEDVINAARVADACSQVDFIASFALPHDVPANLMYVICARTMMENSIKPIFFTAAGKEDLEVIHQMASLISGGMNSLKEKPFIIHYAEPTAPLTHSYGALNKLLYCADHHIPICYTAGDSLGGSTPVTLAGGMAQANAESLSGVVIHQLKSAGAPIISGIGLVPLDMKTSIFSYGAPEFRLTNSAFADLYHHYGLPMWSTVGSDAHGLDEQAAMEHAFGTLLAALDGANLIHDIGYLGQGLLGDPASIVLCSEIIGYVRRLINGFEINDHTLALDLIKNVGPGGDFLAEVHTARNHRKELWRPQFSNRDTHDGWLARGGPDFHEVVKKKAREILAYHTPRPLSQEVLASLATLYEDAERRLFNFEFQA
jgi:trimethylamine--corrinoid protein Co-methyltransferase